LDNNRADKFSWEEKWNRNQQQWQDVKDGIIAEKLQRKALEIQCQESDGRTKNRGRGKDGHTISIDRKRSNE